MREWRTTVNQRPPTSSSRTAMSRVASIRLQHVSILHPPKLLSSARSGDMQRPTSTRRNDDPYAATATVTTMPPQLTPQIISRAQKHCRFAISSLDYEDREQAVKELREALRLLGG